MSIKIGTRGSRLALAQTGTVIKKLTALGISTSKVIISTQGDTSAQVPLHEIGEQGVFVRALDDAILADEIDCAVHSMKDIPAIRPCGLFTAAILKRDSPADYLAHACSLSGVSIIGTSSTRRRAQLLRHDPDLRIKDLGQCGHENKETREQENTMPSSLPRPAFPGSGSASRGECCPRRSSSRPPTRARSQW